MNFASVASLRRLVAHLESAFRRASTAPSDDINVTKGTDENGFPWEAVTFNGGLRSWHNDIRVIIDCVGSLKDHTNRACDDLGLNRFGDKVINGDIHAAVIHDLWNTQKHGCLNHPPRSGFCPKLGDVSLEIGQPNGDENPVLAVVTDEFGESWFVGKDGRKLPGRVKAHILDENGTVFGDVLAEVQLAAVAWNKELPQIGGIVISI